MVRGLVAAGRVDLLKAFEPLVRQRLLDRFGRAAAHPITVVAAPAGFGKTVALTHFLDAAKLAAVRYPLREENASLDGFVRGLLRALETSTAFETTALPTPAEMADLLRDRREAIVIDNLQLAGPEALAFLLGLIERGDEARWILVSRNPLDLPLATWLAYRRMEMPVDEVDLRLSSDEALEIAHLSAPSAADADIEKLLALTGGWPTAFAFGLRLLTRASSFDKILGATREMVFNYLAEQVFSSMNEADRSFLLQTAFLPRLRPEQLRAAGYADASFTLSRLQRLTGFLGVDADGAFVHQSLFQEFLQYQLQNRGKPECDRAMAFAADVLERDGFVVEALELNRRIPDLEALRRILVASGWESLARGALEPVASALAALSLAEREGRSEFIALAADVKARRGQFGGAVTLYKKALAMLTAEDARFDVAARFVGTLCDRLDVELAREVLAQATGSAQDHAVKARVLAVGALVSCYSGAKSSEVLRSLLEANELATLCGKPVVRADVLQKTAEVELLYGLLDDAQKDASAALAEAEADGLTSLSARSALTLARVAAATCDYERAAWRASQALRWAELAPDRAAWLAALAEAYFLAAVRDDAERLAELDNDLASGSEGEYRPALLTSAFALRLAWGADFPAAHELLQANAASDGDVRAAVLRSSEIALYAAAANARDAAEDAVRDWLARIGTLDGVCASSAASMLSRIWIALASLLLGRAAVANNTLREVERAARDIPPPLRELCGLARAAYVHAETGAAHTDVLRALDAAREAGFAGYARLVERLPLPDASPSPRFGSLTRTEVRVLRLLAAGGSSKSIGAELARSSQTIDSHVKAVIRKLGCSGRQEAVVLARQHGII